MREIADVNEESFHRSVSPMLGGVLEVEVYGEKYSGMPKSIIKAG